MTLQQHFCNQKTTVTGPLMYVTSSLFLWECYQYLTSMGENEVMHFVTGINLGPIRIIDNMQKVAMNVQSPVHVEADLDSTFEVLINLDEHFGHMLHAYFHSHPGGFCSPSSVDLNYQKQLEKGHYKTIGGIFTRDGKIRFFSHRLPFTIEVCGKGVERIDATLFQFTKTDFFTGETSAADTPDGTVCNRPAGEGEGVQSGDCFEYKNESRRCRWSWKRNR
jgi:proteasome lid subunit RPN8/RPN11